MRACALSLLGLVLFSGATAFADPVTVTGSVTGNPIVGSANIDLNTDLVFVGFSTDGLVSPLAACNPCSAANPITLGFSSTVSISNAAGGIGDLRDPFFSTANFNGNLAFSGPTFSSSVLSSSNLTLTAPFSMTGTLSALPNSGVIGPIFHGPVAGTGTATAQFVMEPSNVGQPQSFAAQSISYQFSAASSPSPTPEPASLLLLGSGLVGIALRRGRGKRRTKYTL